MLMLYVWSFWTIYCVHYNTLKQPLKSPQQPLKITYKPIPDAQGEHVRVSVDIEGVVRATDDGEIGSADGAAEADKGPNHVS